MSGSIYANLLAGLGEYIGAYLSENLSIFLIVMIKIIINRSSVVW